MTTAAAPTSVTPSPAAVPAAARWLSEADGVFGRIVEGPEAQKAWADLVASAQRFWATIAPRVIPEAISLMNRVMVRGE